jgi:hypothetical protein
MLGYASTQYSPDLTNPDTTQTKRHLHNAKGPYVTIGFFVLRNDVPFELSSLEAKHYMLCKETVYVF